jgi:AGZA family xanthine/uracil permease-like MFS transporter
MLERFFGLGKRGTTVPTEVLGGLTTFVTMAYIIVLNPYILGHADLPETDRIPVGPSTVATILVAVFGTLLMGIYANRPIAVAPYMGENAFLAFGLAALGITWQQRLGSVFIAGLVFLVLTVLRLRSWLAGAISPSLKHAFAAGIGLFLLLLGLYQTGLVARPISPATPLEIGKLRDPRVLLAIGGFLAMTVLLYHRVPGAILLGIVATAAAGYALGHGEAPRGVAALPFTGDYDLSPIALQCDVRGVLEPKFLPVLVTLVLMSFLDTLGTLVGVGAAGGMLDDKGDFPEVHKPMLVDAVSCVFAASVGTSTSGAYIESAAGIREGARTGLAAVTTALLFAVALFSIPLVEPLQKLTYATGPALMAVGVLMLGSVAKIDYADLTEVVPAVATIAMMVFTYNIANGLTAGLVLYPLFKLAAGRLRELRLGAVVLGLVCLVYYVFGLPH